MSSMHLLYMPHQVWDFLSPVEFIYLIYDNALYVALAAVSCLRSITGFGFPLFAPAMYQALGYGKGDTILAVVAIVIGCPAYVYLFIFGCILFLS